MTFTHRMYCIIMIIFELQLVTQYTGQVVEALLKIRYDI